MRKLFNIKSAVITLACTFVFALGTTTVVTNAATITEKPDPDVYTVGVGSTTTVGGANVKINKKKPSKKLKKKIKIVNFAKDPSGVSYDAGGAYFASRDAYADSNAYNNATQYRTKFKATASYDLQFKKTGTYTITNDTYSTERIYFNETEYKEYIVFYKYQGDDQLYLVNGSFQKVDRSNADLFESVEDDYGYYYKSTTGVIVDSFWDSETYDSYYAYATLGTDSYGDKTTIEKPGSIHFDNYTYYNRVSGYFYKNSEKNGTLYFKGNSFIKIPSEQADIFTRKATPETNETYYQAASGVIFASKYYYDDDYDSNFVRSSLQNGADKKLHVKFNAANIVKTVHTTKYRVVKKNATPIASITLGKAKSAYTDSYAASGKSTDKNISQRFLTGSNGKLTVKTNKGYAIQSIIVQTYDAKGNVVFQQARNKGTVNFGDFKSGYTNEDGTFSHSLYKPTTVYVNYKNKASGDYTRTVVENLTRTDGTPYQRLKIYTGYNIKNWQKNNPGKQFQCSEDSTCADHTPHTHSYDVEDSCTEPYTFYKK